jgi:hypothetical protein
VPASVFRASRRTNAQPVDEMLRAAWRMIANAFGPADGLLSQVCIDVGSDLKVSRELVVSGRLRAVPYWRSAFIGAGVVFRAHRMLQTE